MLKVTGVEAVGTMLLVFFPCGGLIPKRSWSIHGNDMVHWDVKGGAPKDVSSLGRRAPTGALAESERAWEISNTESSFMSTGFQHKCKCHLITAFSVS